jgi:poly-gamma-glutamate capsule biosynthesis protein CapA/YwtB (metallophosphatase superfamily)
VSAVVLAVGDVGVRRVDCASMFTACADALRSGDLCFGQLESTISARGARAPNARLAMRAPPAMAAAVRAAGFDVMSFAGNHCLDWGYEAFDDTFAHARAAGLALCGAGQSLELAREPVVLRAGELKVAVLAASSILPEGYAAEAERAGCAPLRAHTWYEQIEHDQPGTPARVRSFTHRGDLAALQQSIAAARRAADAVLVSLHWGIHMVPGVLADYQIEAAHALIDAGADAILGHHPHLLKGVEIYRGKPVFYSLGNFAIEQPHIWDPAIVSTASFRHLVSLNPDWRPDRSYMLPEVTRATGIARLSVATGGAIEAHFMPAWIGDDSTPRMLQPAEPEFSQVLSLLQRGSQQAGFTTRFASDGQHLRID